MLCSTPRLFFSSLPPNNPLCIFWSHNCDTSCVASSPARSRANLYVPLVISATAMWHRAERHRQKLLDQKVYRSINLFWFSHGSRRHSLQYCSHHYPAEDLRQQPLMFVPVPHVLCERMLAREALEISTLPALVSFFLCPRTKFSSMVLLDIDRLLCSLAQSTFLLQI